MIYEHLFERAGGERIRAGLIGKRWCDTIRPQSHHIFVLIVTLSVSTLPNILFEVHQVWSSAFRRAKNEPPKGGTPNYV